MATTAPRGRRFLRAAGISAWVFSGIPAVLMVLGLARWEGQTLKLAPDDFAVWAGAWLVFIASFWLTSGGMGEEHPKRRNRILLVVQAVAALLMFDIVCTGLETTLLAVVAAQLGVYVRLPVGLLWLGLQTIGLGWLGLQHWNALASLGWVTLTLPFQVLSFFTSYFAASEQQARLSLMRTNAELRATQELLAESSRVAERSRISSEMHDLLGHHLTALSINLEVALHHAGDEARNQIEKCQSLTKKLLGDVREVVRSLRGEESVDLARVLGPLTADIPHPRIHLTMPKDVKIYNPDRAHALVRCVQEIVTNAVKHAGADNLWVEFVKTNDELEVRAWDDGRGVVTVKEGHGLRGMRERLEKLGGHLEIEATPRRGFRLNAFIPLAGA